MIPSRRVLAEAEAENKRLGHENLGFLSQSHGFMPTSLPSLQLSSRAHRTWDEIAASLPEMFRHLTLRRTLEQMPILSALPEDLPDGDVLRASVILGIFAHAYHYVQPDAYEKMPEAIQHPWLEISQRLQQPAPNLSFIDMNIYNYRLLDTSAPDPMRMENLDLLIPILGNEAERRFQMVPTEVMDRFTPVLLAAVRAQEAVAAEDTSALKDELRLIADAMQSLVYGVFSKVNPNAYHPLYVNPVVWGKTVAPLATPFNAVPGPSGTAIPAFQQLDILFGRGSHATSIGKETNHVRNWFPPHWRAFLDAFEAISVADYVKRVKDRQLTGIFQAAIHSYAGETGLLGRHRLKTYGYLDLSFKAGRSKTLSGFAGAFDDRMWDKMDGELERARLERYTRHSQISHFVPVKSVQDVRREGENWVKQITFDLRGTGLSCQPGDRCAVLPENDPALVQKTLDALRARGDEPILLNALWREAVKMRDSYQDAKILSLRTLLTFGCLRPVSRTAAKTLYGVTHHEALRRILEARAEDQWELWDLLTLLGKESGFDTRRLWKAEPGEAERICRVVPPEAFRIYSIAAIATDAHTAEVSEIQLMVGQLRYQTLATDVSRSAIRSGVGSGYLSRLDPHDRRRISIRLIHPPRFSLPADPQQPIVMFAGGTGLAPFRSLIQARAAQSSGENWLFFGTRTPQDLYYAAELETLTAQGHLQLRAAFSRADVGLALVDGHFTFPATQRSYIDQEMLKDANAAQLYHLLQSRADGGLGATLYVCGHADFAVSVMNAIKAILARYGAPPETLYRLVGEDRYLQEVFTTYAGAHFAQTQVIDASAVVDHNNDEDGYWAILDGRVYDLSEFAHLHPGGLKIMRSYAGMDATAAYRMVLHNVNPEVDALLSMYEIGVVRRLDLSQGWGVALSPSGLKFISLQDVYRTWVRLLYQVVEMENALANDFSVRHEAITYNENLGEISPSAYRWQHYLQSHLRFRRDYQAKIMGEPLQQLWLLTGSLCDKRAEAGWMKCQISAMQESAAAEKVSALEAQLAIELHNPQTSTDMEAACIRLEQADRAFLQKVKCGLRTGLTVFEQYESGTLTYGREALLATMRELPKHLDEYYRNLSA